MEKNKKAQGAVEYLLNYGWVILSIIAVVVGMWYLGIFNPQQGSTVTVSGFSILKALNPSVVLTTDCNFSGIFINGAGHVINITDIEIYNIADNWLCQDKISGIGQFDVGADVNIKQSKCCSKEHFPGEAFSLRITIRYFGQIANVQVERVEQGNIYGFYTEKSPTIKNCADWYNGLPEQGHCCSPPKVCSEGFRLPAADCAGCCKGPGNTHCVMPTTTTTTTTTIVTTTTITTTTTTTTTTSTTTTTTLKTINVVQICNDFYYCGRSDGICPSNFCTKCTCSNPDPDC